jgi:pyruvate/2-oxoglutarate dehydrogenase complex dihydrolipoamide dehydrogenase (E3) component
MERAAMSAHSDDDIKREWIANVHPPNYVPPQPAERYNLVVIGGGPAGLVCAAGAAGLGAAVALVERGHMGGDCLNVGCVPSKALIHCARVAAMQKGTATDGTPASHTLEHVRKLRAEISKADSVERFSKLGVHVFLGEGRFSGRNTIDVGGVTLKFARAAITVGSGPKIPDVPGLAEAGYETNLTIFERTTLPSRLCVIGGGPIGCELAQAFRRLGAEVTVLQSAARLLPRDDAKASALILARFEAEGVHVRLGAKVTKVSKGERDKTIEFEINGKRESLSCDTILVAAGRRVDTAALNLSAAGIQTDKNGIVVDDFLRTANRDVYAAGDCCSKWKFTHAADAMARMLIRNALFFGRERASKLIVPWTTYTEPEIAQVGITADEAERAGAEILTVEMKEVDRAALDGATEGFARLMIKRGSDKILGATLAAAHAGDLIATPALAMTHGLGASKLSSTIFPYPTQAEVWRKLGDAYNRTRLTPRAKRILGAVLRWRKG